MQGAHRLAFATAVVGVGAWIGACGLDESGLLGDDAGLDVTTPDAGADVVVPPDASTDTLVDNYQPPVCQDLDASLDTSCIGSVPDGWVPVGAFVNPGSTLCPGDASDFAMGDWVTNLAPAGGACVCGPGVPNAANWTCGGNVTVEGGTNNPWCDNAGTDTFPAGAHCSAITVNGANAAVAATAPTPTAPSGCTSTPTAFATQDSPVRTCRPLQCSTNYCGLAGAGYKQCIQFTGVASCPGGFNFLAGSGLNGQIGAANDIQGSCKTCSSSIDTAGVTCTASMITYSNTTCDDAGYVAGPLQADGTCRNAGGNIKSISYAPGAPPAAKCTAQTGGGANGPAFGSPKTVCCK